MTPARKGSLIPGGQCLMGQFQQGEVGLSPPAPGIPIALGNGVSARLHHAKWPRRHLTWRRPG